MVMKSLYTISSPLLSLLIIFYNLTSITNENISSERCQSRIDDWALRHTNALRRHDLGKSGGKHRVSTGISDCKKRLGQALLS